MIFTELTRAQFDAIPEPMRVARRARWAHIVANLRADHYARYHGERDARLVEWARSRGVA